MCPIACDSRHSFFSIYHLHARISSSSKRKLSEDSSDSSVAKIARLDGERADHRYRSVLTLSNIAQLYNPLTFCFKYLTVRDLLRVSMSCKYLNRIASEPSLVSDHFSLRTTRSVLSVITNIFSFSRSGPRYDWKTPKFAIGKASRERWENMVQRSWTCVKCCVRLSQTMWIRCGIISWKKFPTLFRWST